MLATLTGDLCLLAGLAVLLLPLLATELSRPRDGAWGAVILLLGLVLVTSSDRLRGAPMLGVACAGLLISRLGAEVGQARWQQLSDEERQRLGSRERWATSLQQLTTVLASLVNATADTLKSLKPAAKTGTNKLWVRPEQTSTDADVDAPPSGEISETDASNPDASNGASTGKEASIDKEASTDKEATPQAAETKPPGKKRWVRPDSPEPSLETQEVSSTSNTDESQGETSVKPQNAPNTTEADTNDLNTIEANEADGTTKETDGTTAETSMDSNEDTAPNTTRTDED